MEPITTELKPAPAAALYRDLNRLPFDRFVKIVTSGELKYLVRRKKGQARLEPDPLELSRVWSSLWLDYLDAIRSTEGREKYQLSKEIAILSSRIVRFETYIYLLQLVFSEEIVEELHLMGFEDIALDPEDPEAYMAALQGLRIRSREWSIDLQLKKIELEDLLKMEKERTGTGTGADEQYFLRILDRIATHKRVAVIRAAEITTAEFCAMVNEMVDYNKSLKNKATT